MPEVYNHPPSIGRVNVEPNRAAFDSVVHVNGELSILFPDISQPLATQFGMLSIHDGVTAGGIMRAYFYPQGVTPPNSIPVVPVPFGSVTAPIQALTFTHSLGRYPVVQLLDATGEVVAAEVVHNSLNDFTVTVATAMAGTIIYT